MRFWFLHSGKVSLREQIVTQVTLAILSDELAPGDRLPSTRELARRFHLHANTVSAAYQELEAAGWVTSKRGSGVFVQNAKPTAAPPASALLLDHAFRRFLHSARKLNLPLAEVKDFVQQWLHRPAPTRFLLVESREHLRDIVLAEIRQAVTCPVALASEQDPDLRAKASGAITLVLPTRAAQVRTQLPPGGELLALPIRSASSVLAKTPPVPSHALVGVASAWPRFLETTQTMLLAAGVAPEALLLRNTSERHWQNGLEQTAAVVCDVLTATGLPPTLHAIPFPILSESSIQELKSCALLMHSDNADSPP